MWGEEEEFEEKNVDLMSIKRCAEELGSKRTRPMFLKNSSTC